MTSSSVHNLYTAFPLVCSCDSTGITYRPGQYMPIALILYPTFYIYRTLLYAPISECTSLTVLLSASSSRLIQYWLIFSSWLPASLCLSVYSYGPISVCLYLSLSVLFFILVYILSAYSPDYGLQVNRSLCFLSLESSGNLVNILVVLLSVYLHAYYTKLNSLIIRCMNALTN